MDVWMDDIKTSGRWTGCVEEVLICPEGDLYTFEPPPASRPAVIYKNTARILAICFSLTHILRTPQL